MVDWATVTTVVSSVATMTGVVGGLWLQFRHDKEDSQWRRRDRGGDDRYDGTAPNTDDAPLAPRKRRGPRRRPRGDGRSDRTICFPSTEAAT